MLNKTEDNLSTVIARVRRNDKVTKGGKRSRYGVLLITGDKKGRWSYGFAKNKEVIIAKQKATRASKNSLVRVNLKELRTIHHDVTASHGATTVYIRSAERGTGIIAGGVMRSVFEVLGIKDIVAKCIGSSSPHNVVLALEKAFKLLRTPKLISNIRSISYEEVVEQMKVFQKSRGHFDKNRMEKTEQIA